MKIISVFISAVITFMTASMVAFLSACAAGEIYDHFNSIQDPVVRGDDIGGGLVVLLFGSVGFIVSMLSFIPINKVIFDKLDKVVRKSEL